MEVILSCAEEYLQDYSIIFAIIVSIMKLSPVEMTSKHDEIKKFLLKVESQQPYAIHKCGEGNFAQI